MKNLTAPLAALALAVVSCGDRPHRPVAQGKPACCATNLPPSGTYTDKSLYQLDSTWTTDAGQGVRLGRLQGRVQVVVLFFASCTSACPILLHDLQRIESALPEGDRARVGFTLVTIDPERDTPAALHAYRDAHKLPAGRWTLLRGSADDTLELAALLGVKYKREVTGQFSHSNLISILNDRGEIIHQLAGMNQDIGEIVKKISGASGSSPGSRPAAERNAP